MLLLLAIIRLAYYLLCMIQSFADKQTEALFRGVRVAGFPADILRAAQRKLKMIHYAVNLNDLRVPPANRLEVLKGDRKGYFSIRVNNQWRICFRWQDGNAFEVELVDYH